MQAMLGDLVTFHSGNTPSKSNPDYWNGDIPWISANSMHSPFLRDSDLRVTELAVKEQAKLCKKGDILLLVRGSGLHSRLPIGLAEIPLAFNQDVKAIRSRDDRLTQNYLFYWFRGLQNFLLDSVEFTGIGAGKLDTDFLKSLEISIPPLYEQAAIVRIAENLDRKIELNQKMNQTLEDIAKAIFKSWFVDFDPVRAKAEGRPTGLPDEISDLFPDTFEDSEIGEIPAGWKTSAVSGFADLNTKSINPSNTDEVFDHFSIPAFDNGTTPVADSGKNIKSNKTLMPTECLLVSKLNPDTPRIWYPNKAQGRRQICSTEFLAFTPRSSGKSPFLWGLFTSTPVSERMTAMVTGTSKSHQRVKPRDVLDITVTATPPALVEAFCKVVSPMLERTLLGKEETKTLSELRDTLLPKLISGELRIPDAEKFLEEAGV